MCATIFEMLAASLLLVRSRSLTDEENEIFLQLPGIAVSKAYYLEEWYEKIVSEKVGVIPPATAAGLMNEMLPKNQFTQHHLRLGNFVIKFSAACLKLKDLNLTKEERADRFAEFRNLLNYYATPTAEKQDNKPLMDGSITIDDVNDVLLTYFGCLSHEKILLGASIQHMLMMCELFEWQLQPSDDGRIRYKQALFNYIHWSLAFITFFSLGTTSGERTRVADLLRQTELLAYDTFSTVPGLPE